MPKIPLSVAALLQALRFRDPQTAALAALQDAQWKELLSFCDLMHLTLPLGRTCAAAIPDWVSARIERNFADNDQHFERVKSSYSEMAQALNDRGVECLVIKGFAQYPDFVEDPRLRPQSDVDLYCPRESIFQARDTLLQLGYEENDTLARLGYDPELDPEQLPTDHLPSMSRKTNWQWKGNFFDPEIPVGVELHFRFWNEHSMRLSPPGLDQFWTRRINRSLDEITFSGLSPVDNLAYISLHFLSDVQTGAWIIKYARELAGFLHRHATDRSFWDRWQEMHHDRLRALEAIAFRLAIELFPCDVSDHAAAEMDRLPLHIKEWFQRFAYSPLERAFRPNKDALWLHVAMLESRWDQLAVVRRTLIPPLVPPIDFPGQNTNRQGQPRKFWPSQRYARYGFYIALRVAHHGRAIVSALWHGLCWWLGSKDPGKDFRKAATPW
jgi:hypothetical protein